MVIQIGAIRLMLGAVRRSAHARRAFARGVGWQELVDEFVNGDFVLARPRAQTNGPPLAPGAFVVG
jgi:hypothetical protein